MLQSDSNGVSNLSKRPAPMPDLLSFHILMYSLTDRLFIQGLKALSKQNVERELVERLDANSFLRAIIEIYNSTPQNNRGLRDLAVKITMDHLTTLRNAGESGSNPNAALGTGTCLARFHLIKNFPKFSYRTIDRRPALFSSRTLLCRLYPPRFVLWSLCFLL